MNRPLTSMAVALACTLAAAAPLRAARAWQSHTSDTMTWHADGRIEAVCHEVEVIGGIQGSAWTDTRTHKRVGQLFRCPGPYLEMVQFGIDRSAPGYFGFHYRDKSVRMIVSVHRDGPEGPVAGQRVFDAEDGCFEMPLRLGVPSSVADLWYVEIRPEHLDYAGDRNMVNVTTYDTYPDGRLLSDGATPTGGLAHLAGADVNLRVTRRWQASGNRPGPVVFWAAGAYERIHLQPRDTAGLMLADDPARPVRLRAARGERESVQFVVTPAPGQRVDKATLAVEPLRGPGGASIGAAHVRIEWLRYDRHYARGETDNRLYPDPLAPTDTAVSRPGQPDEPMNVGFWVSIDVPPGTPAGVYASAATVVVNDAIRLSRPIELFVYDFDIPRTSHTRTALFHFGFYTDDDMLSQRAIRMLAEFRIAIDSPWYTSPLQIIRDEMNFSEEAYQIVLGPRMQRGLVANGRLLNELGLQLGCVTPWADTYRMARGEAGGREGIERFWKTYYPILKAEGWVGQIYARMPDEFSADKLEAAGDVVPLFRRLAPGVRLMVTDIDAGTDVERYRRLIGTADIWAQSGKSTGGLTDFFAERMKEGEEVWPYIHEHLMLHVDPLATRLFFWGLQARGYQGATLWSVGPSGKFEHEWFGVTSREHWRAGDGTLWFPGSPDYQRFSTEGLWRSARLYRLLDGLEDREYFWLMNDLADEARRRGVLSRPLQQRVEAANGRPRAAVRGFMGFTHDQEHIAAVRDEVAQVIVDLGGVLP